MFLILMVGNSNESSNEPFLVRFTQGGKYGFLDQKGTVVISPEYEEASMFNEGFASVKVGENFGYFNHKGEMAIEPKFEKAGRFFDGWASAKIDGKLGFINTKGEFEIEPKYLFSLNFRNGLARVSDQTRGRIVIDKNENVMFRLRESGSYRLDVADFSEEGIARCMWGKYNPRYRNYSDVRYGYIRKDGEYIVEPKHPGAGYFQEGLGSLSGSGGLGFIDQRGEVVIPFRYSQAYSFQDGISAVQKDGKWGYINRKGSFIIEPQYVEASGFFNGLAGVT